MQNTHLQIICSIIYSVIHRRQVIRNGQDLRKKAYTVFSQIFVQGSYKPNRSSLAHKYQVLHVYIYMLNGVFGCRFVPKCSIEHQNNARSHANTNKNMYLQVVKIAALFFVPHEKS